VLGSFIGDIVGSIYEFNNIKTKDFPFYGRADNPLFFTDDSVMTAATAIWILDGGGNTGAQPGNGGGDNGGNVCSPSMGGRWVTDGYRWAWQCNNGAYLRNGWYLIDGRYYYFDGNGYMSSGWVRGKGSWYYLGNDGAMQTGWVKSDGRWYYLGNDGAMQTGWAKIGGRWYYLGSDGAMYSGTRTIEGRSYEFSDSGEWIK